MKRRTKHLSVRDGTLIPIGNNFAYVLGDHPNKVDDVDIGPNNKNGLSVNHGEIMQFGGNGVRVFSAEPILGGISPSKLVQAGMNPNAVFAAQERYKDIHHLKDDGSRAKFGDWFKGLFGKKETIADDTPEYYGGDIEPAVMTAALPAKFNGSQATANRYAEGYQFGKKIAKKRDEATKNIVNKILPIDLNNDLDNNALGFTPIIGDILQGVQGIRDITAGNYLKGAIGLGMLAVPNFVEKPIKSVSKEIFNKYKNVPTILKNTNVVNDNPEYINIVKKYGEKTTNKARYYLAKALSDAGYNINNLHEWRADLKFTGAIDRISNDISKGRGANVWIGPKDNSHYIESVNKFVDKYGKSDADETIKLIKNKELQEIAKISPKYANDIYVQQQMGFTPEEIVDDLLDKKWTFIRGINAQNNLDFDNAKIAISKIAKDAKGGRSDAKVFKNIFPSEDIAYFSNSPATAISYTYPTQPGRGYIGIFGRKEPFTKGINLIDKWKLNQLPNDNILEAPSTIPQVLYKTDISQNALESFNKGLKKGVKRAKSLPKFYSYKLEGAGNADALLYNILEAMKEGQKDSGYRHFLIKGNRGEEIPYLKLKDIREVPKIGIDSYDYNDYWHVINDAEDDFNTLLKEFNVEPKDLNRGHSNKYDIHFSLGKKLGGSIDNSDFQNWYHKIAKLKGLNLNPYDKEHYYDYESYYNNEIKPDPVGYEAIRITRPDSHFPDTYKLPGHETFSDESIYSNNKTRGGHWEGNKFIDSNFTKSYKKPNSETEVKNDYLTIPLKGNPLYDITGETKYSDYTNEPVIDFSGIETTNKRPYNVANVKTAYDYFKAQGANDYQIAALLANAIEESGIEPYALDKTDTYYGISQWDKSRYSAARKSKKDKDYSTEIELKDLNDQLSYYYNSVMNGNTRVDWNHGGKGSGYNTAADARQAFKDAASVNDAVKALVLGYVRPTGGIDSYKNRAKVAEQIYKLISKQ